MNHGISGEVLVDAQPPAEPTLRPDKQLVSDLWLDQPDAHEQIDRRTGQGEISDDDAERLHHFVDHGYTSISIDLDDEFASAFERDLDHLWATRPANLAASAKSGGRESFRDFDDANRHIGYRVIDMHSHSERARSLYLHPDIFRLTDLIFGERSIAFQSLYFQYGSEQSLHRDPMFVVTEPPSHLLASWIALEDITADSGPLLYVPGSHRMPWFEFAPDTIKFGDGDDVPAIRKAWADTRARNIEEMGLETVQLTCRRGDAFIWHGSLLHGGAKVANPETTRKSFVTHYSTASHYKSRRTTMKMLTAVEGEPTWRGVSATTDTVLEQNGCIGLDNPMQNLKPLPTPAEVAEAEALEAAQEA